MTTAEGILAASKIGARKYFEYSAKIKGDWSKIFNSVIRVVNSHREKQNSRLRVNSHFTFRFPDFFFEQSQRRINTCSLGSRGGHKMKKCWMSFSENKIYYKRLWPRKVMTSTFIE